MKKLIYTLVILAFAVSLNAQWEFSNGPYLGDGRCFLVTPSKVYAGTNGQGIQYSTDNGIHWNTSGNVGLTDLSVNCFIQMGANFFAGTNGGSFRSTNSGTSWFAVNTGLSGSTVRAFTFAGSVLYAGTSSGVYKTTDNGALWTYTGYGIGNSNVYGLTILNGALYAGTYGGGVFKSTDNGNSWVSSNIGLINQSIYTLYVSGSTIYAGTAATTNSDGLYKSTNYGASWISSGLLNLDVRTLVFYSSYLYAGTSSGVFRSSNNGTNWSSVLGLTKNVVYSLNFSGTNMLAGHSNGLAVSTNGGTVWDNMGYVCQFVEDFAKAGSYLYLSGSAVGIFASTNEGNSWFLVNNNLPSTRIVELLGIGNNIYAAYATNNLNNNGISYSTNNGANWNTLNFPGYVISSMCAMDSVFYVGVGYKNGSYSLYRSSNNGMSFNTVYSASFYNTSVNDIVMKNSNDVYVSTSSNIYHSTDHGANWTSVYSGNWGNMAVSGDNIFACSFGIYMSSNSGQNWISIGPNGKYIYGMIVYQNNIFVSTDSGFYSTNNMGLNWYPKNQGITFNSPRYDKLFISDNYIFTGLNNYVPSGVDYYGAWRRSISDIINVQNISTEIPSSYALGQNYPNPFNPTTNIKFALTKQGDVKIVVYDIMGKEVQILVNERLQAGTYETTFDGSNLPSGVYFYKLSAGDFTQTKKLTLIK